MHAYVIVCDETKTKKIGAKLLELQVTFYFLLVLEHIQSFLKQSGISLRNFFYFDIKSLYRALPDHLPKNSDTFSPPYSHTNAYTHCFILLHSIYPSLK